MSGNQTPNPYAPPSDPGNGGSEAAGAPQFGQRSPDWSPQAERQDQQAQSPWPVYGQSSWTGSSTPMGQQSPVQPPFPNAGMVPVGPPPGRGGAIALLVSGIVTMVVLAPILFVTLLLSGIGMDRIIETGLQTSNGGEVFVGETGILGVTALEGTAETCTLTSTSGEEIPMAFETESGGMFVARGLTDDRYTIQCTGLPAGTSLMVMDGEFMSDLVGSSLAAFGWATLVGVIGLGMLIAGIIWLVKRNKARRAFYEGIPY